MYMEDIHFHLSCLDAAGMNEFLAVIAETTDEGGEIIIEFAANLDIGNDFFVLEIPRFQFLECVLPVFTLFTIGVGTASTVE